MDLGQYAGYPLPHAVRTAFGVDTAQQLADHLGITGALTPDRARDAESAYNSYRAGDTAPARSLLVSLGVTEQMASDAVAKLPRL